MPKHFATPAEKWTLFLNTVLGKDGAITVTNVTDKKIEFRTTSVQDKLELERLLANPKELREHVLHAVPTNIPADAPDPTDAPDLLKATDQITGILGKSPLEVLNSLLDPKFMELTERGSGAMLEMDKNPDLHLGQMPLNPKEGPVHRFKIASLELLQAALSNSDRAHDILASGAPKLTMADVIQDDTQIDHSIFQIGQNSATFNYGAFLQKQQMQYNYASSAYPVVASNPNGVEQSIARNHLLEYLHKVLGGSGMLFHQEADGNRPMMFEPQGQAAAAAAAAAQDHVSVLLVLDNSASLEPSKAEYHEALAKLVNSITTSFNSGDIKVIKFGVATSTQSYSFDSSQNSKKEVGQNIITSISADDRGTELYAAMKEMPLSQHDIAILFTDGYDNSAADSSKCLPLEQEVVDHVKNQRGKDSQFGLCFIGFGTSYKAEFFEQVAQQAAANHIDIRNGNLARLDEVLQYIPGANREKVLWEFLVEQLKSMAQVTKGDVTVSDVCIDPSKTKFTKGGVEHTLYKPHDGATPADDHTGATAAVDPHVPAIVTTDTFDATV